MNTVFATSAVLCFVTYVASAASAAVVHLGAQSVSQAGDVLPDKLGDLASVPGESSTSIANDPDDAITSVEKVLEITEQEAMFVRNLFKATSEIAKLSLEATNTVTHIQVLRSYIDLLILSLKHFEQDKRNHDRYAERINDALNDAREIMTESTAIDASTQNQLEGKGEIKVP